jgi:hypothetical protein
MTSLAGPIAPSRKTWRHFRLVRAEILKLRKRLGLVVTTGLLTVGAIVILLAVAVALHAANPGKYEPAGGVANLRGAVLLMTLLGSVAAILVGCTAGAGDLGAGVFRELVVTGRSRLALFAARVPGGLAFLLAFAGLAYALSAVSAVVFAGRFPLPTASTIALGAVWLVVPVGVWFVISLGLASLLGSRTTPIVILLPFNLIVSPLLARVTFLGGGRDVFPGGALDRLIPHALVETPHSDGWPAMSAGTAVLVLAAWVCVSVAVGAWRTSTRDA